MYDVLQLTFHVLTNSPYSLSVLSTPVVRCIFFCLFCTYLLFMIRTWVCWGKSDGFSLTFAFSWLKSLLTITNPVINKVAMPIPISWFIWPSMLLSGRKPFCNLQLYFVLSTALFVSCFNDNHYHQDVWHYIFCFCYRETWKWRAWKTEGLHRDWIRHSEISAVHNLIEILKPQKFYIAVKNFEEKSEEVKKCLLDVMGNSLQQKFQEWSLFCNEPSGDTEESLLISFDGICSESLVPAVRLTVMLSTAQEREMLGRMGVEEPSASSFIHFHGCKWSPLFPA